MSSDLGTLSHRLYHTGDVMACICPSAYFSVFGLMEEGDALLWNLSDAVNGLLE